MRWADVDDRSPQQVTERLDRLIKKIRDIQRPCMNGERPADVVVVRLFSLPSFPHRPLSPLSTNTKKVAHGMSLRCFVKRWLGYPLDMPLAMMLSPGAIGILRYVLQYGMGEMVRTRLTRIQLSQARHRAAGVLCGDVSSAAVKRRYICLPRVEE
jgi:hypothetical protein